MKRCLLDTNVVVRFLLGEPPDQANAAAKLFGKSDHGEFELVLDPLVIAESIFVLTAFYEKGRKEVAKSMELLVNSLGVHCAQKKATALALQHFQRTPKAHWVDCYLAALSQLEDAPVASFDRDFDKLDGATRLDPASL